MLAYSLFEPSAVLSRKKLTGIMKLILKVLHGCLFDNRSFECTLLRKLVYSL